MKRLYTQDQLFRSLVNEEVVHSGPTKSLVHEEVVDSGLTRSLVHEEVDN